jgi:long-chain acyl-CoA synthetase
MLGYWNQPAESESVLRDGWFHSGDIGQTDEQGYFYILDRLKDMIAVGGTNVYPAEVERVLLDHPHVAEAAVVGFPDDLMGEKVAAFLVRRSDSGVAGQAEEGDAILRYCRERLASFKVPSRVYFLEALPRNPSGKVLKTELRQRMDASDAAADDGPTRRGATGALLRRLQAAHPVSREDLLVAHLQREVQDLLGLESPPLRDQAFLEMGMDSIQLVEFQERLQGQLGPQIRLSATTGFEFPTVAALAKHLADAASAPTPPPASAVKPGAGADPAEAASSNAPPAIQEMSEENALAELMRELDE